MSSVTLREAVPSDIPLIRALADRTWRDQYTPMIGQAQVEYMLRKMYSEESLAQQMRDGSRFFIASESGTPVGYISVSDKGDDEFFLNKFYIETKEQGRGLGKIIFNTLLQKFPQLKLMRLQVNRKNFKSINFYFRLGFTIEYVKDFDIGDGFVMEDFVMVRKKM